MSAGAGDVALPSATAGVGGFGAVRGSALGWLLLAAAGLAAAGIGIASYLTVVHYAHQPIACSSIGDCELVNSSKYAALGSVPVALLGAASYAAMLLLVAAAGFRRSSAFVLAAWVIALASFCYSMYLTYIELRVLDAICVYCVGSASVMTALFAVLSSALWVVRDDLFWETDSDAPRH